MSRIFSGVDVGQRALDYHLERHNVLASNVANVETPGFTPYELVRDESTSGERSVRLATTDGAHLGGGEGAGASELRAMPERVAAAGNDENSVSLERELAKVAANHLRYEGAARIVQLQLGTLRYAANDGQGG